MTLNNDLPSSKVCVETDSIIQQIPINFSNFAQECRPLNRK